MQFRSTQMIWLLFVCLIPVPGRDAVLAISYLDENPRMTPLVQAIQQCRKSVVNLRGRKTVPDNSDRADGTKIKQVNGMGTGVVIDSRGYVLTNYHVVQGVKEIEVTTWDNVKTTAVLLAHDPETDLAILKINISQPLPKIRIGSSSDLMLAESVAAVGNAYGYEHTVTRGIISQLGRTVQVNDNQVYRNLIQTDASINPGNSGGPLLNMQGEMIGINVAVRIGAQGIAFAIPVNEAMEVTAKLMNQLLPQDVHHGVVARTIFVDHQPKLVVETIEAQSPGERAGLSVGDQILEVNGTPVSFEAEFQSCFLNSRASDHFTVRVRQRDREMEVALAMEQRSHQEFDKTWELIGVRVAPHSMLDANDRHPMYKSGLMITDVRPGSPAADGGLTVGDVIVAMHGYQIQSLENLAFVLNDREQNKEENFMFYILRGKDPYRGEMRLAQLPNDRTSGQGLNTK